MSGRPWVRQREAAPWTAEAACRQVGPGPFFALEDSPEEAAAKRVCAGCPVRKACRDYAIENHEEFGVWGGLTRKERERERRRRSKAWRTEPIPCAVCEVEFMRSYPNEACCSTECKRARILGRPNDRRSA